MAIYLLPQLSKIIENIVAIRFSSFILSNNNLIFNMVSSRKIQRPMLWKMLSKTKSMYSRLDKRLLTMTFFIETFDKVDHNIYFT